MSQNVTQDFVKEVSTKKHQSLKFPNLREIKLVDIHSMKYTLGIEKEGQVVADMFYRKIGYNIVNRFGWDTAQNKEFQRSDIDCAITSTFGNQIKNLPQTLYVSEKFRSSTSYNDMLVEIYSKCNFPNETPELGWGLKSKADIFYYQSYDEIWLIDAKRLQEHIQKIYEYNKDWFNRTFIEGKATRDYSYMYDDVREKVEFLCIPTTSEAGQWMWKGLVVALPYEWLEDQNLILGTWNINREDDCISFTSSTDILK